MNKACQLLGAGPASLRSLGYQAKTRKARAGTTCKVEARDWRRWGMPPASLADFCCKIEILGRDSIPQTI